MRSLPPSTLIFLADLRSLLRSLAFSKSTLSNRHSMWAKWTSWCSLFAQPSWPPTVRALIDYATYLASPYANNGSPFKYSSLAKYTGHLGFLWRTEHPSQPSPTDAYLFKCHMRGCARHLGCERKKATPMTLATLARISTALAPASTKPSSAWNECLAFIPHLAFWGCLRLGNLVAPAINDQSVRQLICHGDLLYDARANVLRVTIRRSKTNFNGAKAPHLLTLANPVLIRAYLRLIRRRAFRPTDLVCTYSRGLAFTRQRFLQLINKAVNSTPGPAIPPATGHSFRRGHAVCALEAGVPLHVIMLQGDWATTRSMTGYVRDAVPSAEQARETSSLIEARDLATRATNDALLTAALARRLIF